MSPEIGGRSYAEDGDILLCICRVRCRVILFDIVHHYGLMLGLLALINDSFVRQPFKNSALRLTSYISVYRSKTAV